MNILSGWIFKNLKVLLRKAGVISVRHRDEAKEIVEPDVKAINTVNNKDHEARMSAIDMMSEHKDWHF